MKPELIYPVLYDLVATIGAEVHAKPLIMRIMQRLMLHTGLPVSIWIERVEQSWLVLYSIGLFSSGQEIEISMEHFHPGWTTNRELLCSLGVDTDTWKCALLLRVSDKQVIILLSKQEPNYSVPWAEIFEPVMGNLQKAVHLCRINDERTRTLVRTVDEQKLRFQESEGRFRELIEQAPISIQIFRSDGTCLLVNPAWEKMWNAKYEQLADYNVLKDSQLEENGQMESILRAFAGEQVFIDAHFYNPTKNKGYPGPGKPLWLRANLFPLKNQKGQVTHVVIMHEDITDRIKAEKENALLRTAIEQNAEPIMVLDINGYIILANTACAELYGTDVDQLTRSSAALLSQVEQDGALYDKIRKTILKGRVWTGEVILEVEGKKRLISRRVSPVYDTQGIIRYQIVLDRDITEERRRHEKMAHMQRLEALGVLAGGIAHDFNNLLGIIMGNVSLARSKTDSRDEVSEYLENIEKTSHRAAHLCKQMLAYSGKGKFVIQPINLSQMVEEMGSLLEVSIHKTIVMRYELSPHIPSIDADVAQLQQVIMNLVINASEAIGEKNGTIVISTGVMDTDDDYINSLHVEDTTVKPGKYVWLEVSDTGCGMDAETQSRLFEPFFTTKFTGRGLGMSAILGIVRGHQGAIKVYSEVGKGTTIKILFPAVETKPIDLHVKKQAEQPKETGGKVLVVDDEEMILDVASMILQKGGYQVIKAHDGFEALKKLKEHRDEISCVLLDMMMPRMGGEETFSEMRRIKPDVKVLLSSGYNEQTATNRFAGKGLAGFIQKPYTMETLLAKVAELHHDE